MTFSNTSINKHTNKKYSLNEGYNYCWPTTILKTKIKDKILLEKIVNYIIINYLKETPNKLDSHEVDVRGEKNLLNDNFFKEFKENEIIPVFEKYLKDELNIDLRKKKYYLKSWLNGPGVRSNDGYSMAEHNHSGSHLSAVFYLLNENENLGGCLNIRDPRGNANRGYQVNPNFSKMFDDKRLEPKTGDIILFPSFVYHGVETFYGKLRLSMPVDLILEDNDNN
jgi:hypothetical protein